MLVSTKTYLRWVLTQLDQSACAQKGRSPMFSFLRRAYHPRLFCRLSAPPAAAPVVVATPLVREPADRALHQDDQHLVFWNAETSRASAVQLSEAAGAHGTRPSRRAPRANDAANHERREP